MDVACAADEEILSAVGGFQQLLPVIRIEPFHPGDELEYVATAPTTEAVVDTSGEVYRE